MMTKSQEGVAGEELFSSHTIISSAGELELFTPKTDDDHNDFSGGRRGNVPAITIQVKTTFQDAYGKVHFRVSIPAAGVRESPAFVYVIQRVVGLDVPHTWVIPSPDWNRLVPISHVKDYPDAFEFYGSLEGADAVSEFRLTTRVDLGPRLLQIIDQLPPGATAPRLEGAHIARRRAT